MTIIEQVTLRGMRFHTRVGILPHERELRQELLVDITVWRTPSAPGADVLDYRHLHALVAERVVDGIEYLETVAHAVAEAALNQPGVQRARVTLRKPQVALPGPLEVAEVTAEHSRAP